MKLTTEIREKNWTFERECKKRDEIETNVCVVNVDETLNNKVVFGLQKTLIFAAFFYNTFWVFVILVTNVAFQCQSKSFL